MKQLLLSIFICVGIASFSQITYSSTNHASGNYSQQMTSVTLGINALNFDTTGANFTWDYSSLGKDSWGNKKTTTPSASGYQAAYIAQCIASGGGFSCLTNWNSLTNLGMVDQDSLFALVVTLYDVMTMTNKTNSHLIGTVKGLKIKDTTGIIVPLVTEYSSHDTIFNFPFTYLDSGKSYAAWGYDLTSFGQDIQYKTTYNREYQIEGWGKLITPHATYNNTLKVKTTLDQIDSVSYFGTAYGLPRKTVEYTWYDAAFGLPVMKAEGYEGLGIAVINSVSYIDNVYVGTEERELVEFNLYPNPSSDIISITYSGSKKIDSYKILDIQGRIFQQNRFSQSISIADLETGTYIIQLFSDNELVGIEKFVKK